MPIVYDIDRAKNRLRTRIEGQVTVEDILGHFEAVRRERALPFAEVIDASGAGRPFLSPAEVWRAANAVKALTTAQPMGPRAVFTHDDLVFGLTRIFTNLLSGLLPIEAFRDRERAEEWITGRIGPAGLGQSIDR